MTKKADEDEINIKYKRIRTLMRGYDFRQKKMKTLRNERKKR